MSNSRLKMGLSGLSVADYIVATTKVVTDMTTNAAIFTNPPVGLPIVLAAIGQLNIFQQQMESSGGTNNTFMRDAAKAVVQGYMVQLSSYVSSVAAGDGAIILLSGFKLRETSSEVGLLPPPSKIKVVGDDKNAGELEISWQGVKKSIAYVLAIAPMVGPVPGEWTNVEPWRTSHLFTGLVSGEQYAFRVATVSRKGIGTWSAVILHRPQ